jgi:hypothetical protein
MTQVHQNIAPIWCRVTRLSQSIAIHGNQAKFLHHNAAVFLLYSTMFDDLGELPLEKARTERSVFQFSERLVYILKSVQIQCIEIRSQKHHPCTLRGVRAAVMEISEVENGPLALPFRLCSTALSIPLAVTACELAELTRVIPIPLSHQTILGLQ